MGNLNVWMYAGLFVWLVVMAATGVIIGMRWERTRWLGADPDLPGAWHHTHDGHTYRIERAPEVDSSYDPLEWSPVDARGLPDYVQAFERAAIEQCGIPAYMVGGGVESVQNQQVTQSEPSRLRATLTPADIEAATQAVLAQRGVSC